MSCVAGRVGLLMTRTNNSPLDKLSLELYGRLGMKKGTWIFMPTHCIYSMSEMNHFYTSYFIIIGIMKSYQYFTIKCVHWQRGHKNGKAIWVAALVFTGDIEACLQHLKWWPGQSSWCPFCLSEAVSKITFLTQTQTFRQNVVFNISR